MENIGFSFIRSDKCPTNSHDLKSFDYNFWNKVEERLECGKYQTRAVLEAAIKTKVKKFSQKMIQKVMINLALELMQFF